MEALTKKEKQDYLSNPSCCPKCKSDDIESDGIEADGCSAWAKVKCNTCEAEWTDIYTLTNVENK